MNTRTLLIGLLSCTLWACCAAAQPPDAPQLPPGILTGPKLAPPSPEPIISIDFPGGTVKGFVDAIRRAADKVNIILPKDAENVPIPAVLLKEVSPYTALKSLQYAVGNAQFNQFGVARMGEASESGKTFGIQYINPVRNEPFPENKETMVVSIRDLIEAPTGLESNPGMVVGTETILNALRTASELDQQAHALPPEIMLHKESMLLIVRGTQRQLATVSAILNQLSKAMADKRRDFTEGLRRLREVKLERFELDAEIAQNQTYLKAAEEDVGRASDWLAKAGPAESMAAKGEVSKAKASLENARSYRHLLNQRNALLRSREEAGGMDASSPESSAVGVYDIRDLKPFYEDVLGLARAITTASGSKGSVQLKAAQDDENGTIVVRATPAEHRALVRAFNLVRRARANEPKLPGLDADELIRKGEGK